MADTVLTDAANWADLQAALGRMAEDRRMHVAGINRDPTEIGLLRTAARRGQQSSEYAKVLNSTAMSAELTSHFRGNAQ